MVTSLLGTRPISYQTRRLWVDDASNSFQWWDPSPNGPNSSPPQVEAERRVAAHCDSKQELRMQQGLLGEPRVGWVEYGPNPGIQGSWKPTKLVTNSIHGWSLSPYPHLWNFRLLIRFGFNFEYLNDSECQEKEHFFKCRCRNIFG